ncbi:MAG: hypothetical protein Q7T44_18335 [Parvibaculum sp.]|nr:hypothetical protein [Parvibaculum sp.]
MVMKSSIEILSVEEKSGVSKKSGQPYNIRTAHVILDADEGRQVGVLNLPKDMEKPNPGLYTAEFGIGVDFASRQVTGRLIALHHAGKAAAALK